MRKPETIATAIRIGSPASWATAVEAQQQSNGRFLAATDEEILAAYHLVAAAEGVFVEPASAASIAGLLKAIHDGWVAPDQPWCVRSPATVSKIPIPR
ncbi:pyridoxal-phosphate dependent enzyme family protein [Mycobacterium xenopi 4042]|uniref:Pyridoxal-phosphate dependent enzyme family protein n=1 Tax=Mycobacterium xenopi 4042 TaxID=1299334 RepID=X8E0Y4_MYCXE|nr:pyridoxal-phosphate dependent enzyme family protein [Mycobacterium xenopi 3993]EUA73495.1 pyridoxal-phosphate dependent enzyme family protein [Mycobacterium xenopi 4042]